MGAFSSVIGGFIVQLIAKLVPLLSKKAMAVAFMASYTLVVVAFIGLLNGLLSRLITSAPTGGLIQVGLSLMPSNTGTCIGIIAAAYAARWIFIWKISMIKALIKS